MKHEVLEDVAAEFIIDDDDPVTLFIFYLIYSV